MMRYFRYLVLALISLVLVLIALANRSLVSVQLLPDELSFLSQLNIAAEVPLFLVLFAGVLIGLLIGFVWEWIREYKYRAAAKQTQREKEQLERQVQGMRESANEGKDEVLALLDDSAKVS